MLVITIIVTIPDNNPISNEIKAVDDLNIVKYTNKQEVTCIEK